MGLGARRSTSYPRSGETSGERPLTLIVPRRRGHGSRLPAALQRVGLGEPGPPRTRSTRRGVFRQLAAVGGGVAWFADSRGRDGALNELADGYDLLDDCPVSLSAQPAVGQLTAEPPRDPWPDASGVVQAHAAGVDGRGVIVAVLDTGIDADHAEFVGRHIPFRHVSLFPNSLFWPPRDVRGFDPGGHGTHVCGTIAGRNVGVAPGVSLLVASVVESETTRTSLVRVAYGLDWVLRELSRPDNAGRPAVLNMSVGFPAEDRSVSAVEMKKRLGALRALLASLIEANVLPVVAVGNEGSDACALPGAFAEVLAVGAVDAHGARAGFSGGATADNSSKPDLMGYGVGVCSANERDARGASLYRTRDGTSMAAPYVSGIAALYRSREPGLGVLETWQRLRDTALPLEGPWTGAGLARWVG